jgi:UDP-N-acetylmuramoylalanine--D-glutamate ligase
MDQEALNRLTRKSAQARLVNARQRSLEGFASGPHRMEHVTSLRGVDYINDSKSTFLDSTLEALVALDRPVVWIAGALEPDVARGQVQDLLKERVVALVLFGRNHAGMIDALRPFTEQVYFAEELRTAVFVAHELARSGEVVLFSPACPSGDGFANYEERGTEFKRAVKDL